MGLKVEMNPSGRGAVPADAAALSTASADQRSGCTAQCDHREVDFGLGDLVDVVGQGVERDVKHDLHDLRIVESGGPYRGDIGVTDVPARVDDLGSEAHGGVRLLIVGCAGTVGGDLGIVKLGDVLADEGVG